MAFDSLTNKLQEVFKKLRGKGRLTEDDVKLAMKEVKIALLEADVNFKVVKKFINDVTERAIGSDVLESLTPGQQVIKIVNEELISLMGSEVHEIELQSGKINVLMMLGLQGAGKTTTACKLAAKYKSAGKKPLLVALDIHRPAAIDQLLTNAKKLDVDAFSLGTEIPPCDIAEKAVIHAKENGYNLLIFDTAGRLQIDEEMMNELKDIAAKVQIDKKILTVDAMTGQDAVNIACTFDEEIGIDGIIITKLDGDTRGGAALSIVSVTGKHVYFAGMGEKLSDLEPFYPDRMASRILGMGDVLSLIEKAQETVDTEKTAEMAKKMSNGKFDFNDFLEQSAQLRKMGDISDLINMIPGAAGKISADQLPDEKQMKHTESIILSMTAKERSNPDIINPSRRKRIAKGAGVPIEEVNRLIKQFENSRKMMKQMTGMLGKKNRFGKLKFPF